MPDAATISLFLEKFGWPGLTVGVLLFIVWRIMLKHEGQMGKITEVNQQIVTNLQAVASTMGQHDRDEERRHDTTQKIVERWPR